VAQANGGTLFLDEVEAMSPRAQAVLLRFLQGKEYRPVGANLNKEADVRVVASSNANLKQLVQRGLFRSDLLFRLNALSLHLPLLSERAGDIPILAAAFLDRLNRRSDQPPKILHPDSLIVLEGYAWPGNVRELENLLHREFLLAPGRMIRILCIDPDRPAEAAPQVDPLGGGEAFKVARARAIAQFEKAYLTALLSRTAGNLSLASRLSGKDRSDIGRLVRKYQLDRHQFAAQRR
jgi:DNA-binding NtrC family response regulator